MPESGYAVQTINAVIVEIADVFVINKVDLGGAEKTRRLIQDAMALGPKQALRAPLVRGSAAQEGGVAKAWAATFSRHAFLKNSRALNSPGEGRVKKGGACLGA